MFELPTQTHKTHHDYPQHVHNQVMQELLYKHSKDPKVQQEIQQKHVRLEERHKVDLQKKADWQASSTSIQVQRALNDLVENTMARFKNNDTFSPNKKDLKCIYYQKMASKSQQR